LTANHQKKCYNRQKSKNTSTTTFTNPRGDFFLKKFRIEFICYAEGEIFTYDINTNTNYNSDAEEKAGKYGMLELAKVLKDEWEKI
jgi:hypothetical protein